MRAVSPNRCVLDTDVVSYTIREDTRRAQFEPYVNARTAYVSFMTVAELDLWAVSRTWGEPRRERIARFLERFPVVFAERELCRRWAAVRHEARTRGRRIGTADAWVAATALELGLPLITNNRDDFAGVPGLILLP